MTLSLTLPRIGLPLHASDLRGLTRLGIDGVVGVTDVVEAMHQGIATAGGRLAASPASIAAGRTSGITGFVYRRVRGTTRAVGRGLDTVLGLTTPQASTTVKPEREAFMAALNGVFGDHLADSGNPLAIDMSLRIGGRPWREALTAPTGRVLVQVHGLAMNDLQWTRRRQDGRADLGQSLAKDLGYTPVHLHYNSGRHVSQNGRDFSARLDELIAAWPLPVQELVILGHSMGGLVARSAILSGEDRPWRQALRALVCLGTPHHGAPLERGGHVVDTLLGASAFVAPLARLGRARSAGITDLRYGNLQDADWLPHVRHTQTHDDRQPAPLPSGVDCFMVAATKARSERPRLPGDGLVPVASALGDHADPARALGVPAAHRHIVHDANHWDLLDHPEVLQALRGWLR